MIGTPFEIVSHDMRNPDLVVELSDLNVMNALLPVTTGLGARFPQYEPKYIHLLVTTTFLKHCYNYYYLFQEMSSNIHCKF